MTSLDDLSRPEHYDLATILLTDVTDVLMDTVKRLDDDAVHRASLCADWTRGHVLTHVARNADALRNLVNWARSGEETPMYPSREQRDADIDAGATRSASDLESDVEASADRLLADLLDLPVQVRGAQLRTGAGLEVLAQDLPYYRAREVVFHHVDLDAGYTFADVPAALVHRALVETGERLASQDVAPLVLVAQDTGQRVEVARGNGGGRSRTDVTGTADQLLAWASGRSDGAGLAVSTGRLPTLPPWG